MSSQADRALEALAADASPTVTAKDGILGAPVSSRLRLDGAKFWIRWNSMNKFMLVSQSL